MSSPLEPSADEFRKACRSGGTAMDVMMARVTRAYAGRLRHVGIRLACGRAAMADDAVQQTLVKVWLSCLQLQRDGLLPWIMTVLRHTLYDELRTVRRDAEEPIEDAAGLLPEVEAAWSGHARRDDVEDRLTSRELDQLFERCMVRFERDYPDHALVIRGILYDLEPADLMAQLGRTYGATRELASQARKKARVYLAEWYAAVEASRRRTPASSDV